MPFTPLHMGPGVLVKAVFQGGFSLMVFGWAQIVMDIQPLVVLLMADGHLHGFTHTYLGATLLALLSALTGKYLCEVGLRLLKMLRYVPIRWPVAFVSAFVGTYSHVLLDSVMHADVQPFAPLSTANGLLNFVSPEALQWMCLGTFLLGGAVWLAMELRFRRKGGLLRPDRVERPEV
ncbi:MAG: hypothetical protein P8Z33_13300 [Gammaproteobacteria bacterium]